MHPTRFALALASTVTASILLAGCAPEEEAPPPVFNAKDLSLQCPTGQVGWDFSTGGNDTPVREDDISREITIDSATLGTCDYKADFAAECDGKRLCTRVVKKQTSPACAGGEFTVKYRCGEEKPQYEVVVANDASAKSVTLGCGEGITIVSAIFSSNGPTPAQRYDISSAVSTSCTGRRRCSLQDPYAISGYRDVYPNVAKETTVRFYCGNETRVRETVFASGERIDIQCLTTEAKPAVFNDTIRVVGLECVGARCNEPSYQSITNDWNSRIRNSCEGKKSCRLDVPETNIIECPNMRVSYWCSSPQASEQKVFVSRWGSKKCAWGAKEVELHCGEGMNITGASGADAQLEAAKAACNAKSTCTLPTWSYDGGSVHSATYTYTCGDNLVQTYTRKLENFSSSPLQEDERQADCPAPSNALFGGIRPLRAEIGGGNAILAVTNSCFGRANCTVDQVWATDVIEYRCGSSIERKTAKAQSNKFTLNCAPDVVVDSLMCDHSGGTNFTSDSCPSGEYLRRHIVSDMCPAGNNGECRVLNRRYCLDSNCNNINPFSNFELKYHCGGDPKQYTYTGTGDLYANSEFLRQIPLKCDVPDKPYVEKACIPEYCAGKARRDHKLRCIPDSTKTGTEFFIAPIVKEWLPGADGGGTSQWGGAEVSTLKEDVPYQVFSFAHYRADNGVQLPAATTATVWAYDEFVATADAGVASNVATTFGFRCIIAEADIANAEYPTQVAGYRKIINGGRGGVIPPTCYRQEVADGRTAWSDGARRVGIPESQFRAKYTRKQSWVVSSLDSSGKNTVRRLNGNLLWAVNPVGFFFNSNNGWLDQLSYYLQSVDLRFKVPVSFVESNDIVLNAVSTRVRKSQLFVDVSEPTLLPQFDVDFVWNQRGDSPARNPYSPKSMLSANSVNSLNKRRLRASIEIARADSTPGANNWLPVTATQFSAVGLGKGNAFSQTTRLSAQFTSSLRDRLLAVKGSDAAIGQTSDGWMAAFDEEKTTFRVRVCMDFDDKVHALGSTTLDNDFESVVRDGTKYQLGFGKRCAEADPIEIQRELFTYPTYPTAVEERPGNAASTARQGDSATNSDNDNGNQNVCDSTGGVKRKCAGATRSNMASGGQFPGSPFEAQSDSEQAQDETTKTTKLSTKMKLFGFQIFDLSKGGMKEMQSAGAWSVKLDLTPNLKAIEELIKSRRQAGGVKTDAKTIKTTPKGKKGAVRNFFSKFEREGLAMVLSKGIPFTLGPFPFTLELGFSVGFGFGVSLELSGDRQTTTSQFEPKYGCLRTGSQRCITAYDTKKTWEGARQECNLKGGRLAEVRTQADLDEVKAAVATVGTATDVFWLGGQLAYRYADPRCDTSRDPRCAGISSTKYVWLTGNQTFARTTRQEKTLLTPADYLSSHPFGSNVGTLVSLVPNDGAIMFKRDTSNVTTAPVGTEARYACEFDPASAYVEFKTAIEAKVEFTVGFTAALCTPSEEVGFCIGIGINLVNAGVNVTVSNSNIVVFNGANRPVTLLGQSSVEGTWEVAFLSGALSAELRLLFWNTSWEIASYQGIFAIEGELFPAITSPYRKAL